MAVLGFVERINREKITGWVIDQKKPDRRHVVELYVGERQITSAPATIERLEVAQQISCDRNDFGFELAVPYGTPLDAQKMAVRVVGADILLPVLEGAARLEGVLDFVAGSTIGGWAWHTGRPTERISVIVRHKDEVLTTLVADGFRQDLFEAGVGDGAHGFIFDLGAVANAVPLVLEEVEVAFASTGDPLFNLIKHGSAIPQFGNRIAN
jgi:hypothetical protein